MRDRVELARGIHEDLMILSKFVDRKRKDIKVDTDGKWDGLEANSAIMRIMGNVVELTAGTAQTERDPRERMGGRVVTSRSQTNLGVGPPPIMEERYGHSPDKVPPSNPGVAGDVAPVHHGPGGT